MQSKKIWFELEQDADGYPPDKWEGLWADEVGPGLYRVDNIPFYVKGISSGDEVSAEVDADQLQFKKLVRATLNSVFRLYVSDAADMKNIRNQFRALGCESERSNLPKLVAIEIPGDIEFGPIGRLLEEGAASERWEYEEGVLRHRISG